MAEVKAMKVRLEEPQALAVVIWLTEGQEAAEVAELAEAKSGRVKG